MSVERGTGIEVDRSPSRVGSALALCAGALALAPGASVLGAGVLLGALGFVSLLNGLLFARRGLLTLGSTLIVAGVLVAGVEGAPTHLVLGGVVAGVLAWDVGQNAIELGEQLGREAGTARTELLHAGASAAVGLATAGLGYGVYLVGVGGRPVAAVALLLFAAAALVAALS